MTRFRMPCAAFLVFACTAAVAEGSPSQSSWEPTLAQVAEVEARLSMPKGTTLLSYSRYYTGKFYHGHRLLQGTFVTDAARAGIYIVPAKKHPKVLDGGCSVVNLSYDMTARQTVSIFCNGAG